MTVMTTSRRVIGVGNGATTVWPYAFLIPLANQLSVVYTNPNRDAIDPTGLGVTLAPGAYSVTGIGNVNGGTVTYPLAGPAVAAPATITIVRTIPKTQPSTMQNQGASYPAAYEGALDNIEMQVQEVSEIFLRTPSFPIGYDPAAAGVSLVLPPPVANTVLGWDPTAKFLVNLAAVPGLVIAPLIGGLLFGAAGNTVAQDAANLFWDNATKRLGIGNAAPTVALDVTGAIKSTGPSLTVSNATPNLGLIDPVFGAATIQAGVNSGGTGVGNFLMFGVPTGKSFTFAVNNVLKASIDASGNFTAVSSVATPLVSNNGADLLIDTISGNTNIRLQPRGGGNVIPNDDNAHTFGASTNRWSVVFAPIIDSGTAGSLSLRTGNGTTGLQIEDVVSGVNALSIGAGAAGNNVSMRAQGASTNIGIDISPKGTGQYNFFSDNFALTQFQILRVASAARNITVAGATAGNNPILGATAGGVAIVGTTTSDNAATGQYGEFVEASVASGAAVVLATGAASNVTSITLGAGDWDVSGTMAFLFGATTSYTNLIGAISTLTGALDAFIGGFFDYETPAVVPTAGSDQFWALPTRRISIATSTTIFLVAQATFTVSTLKAYGRIRARRVR